QQAHHLARGGLLQGPAQAQGGNRAAMAAGVDHDRFAAALNKPCGGGVVPIVRRHLIEAPMATRPTWQGPLRLSLVIGPVALYTGTWATGEVHFNLLHKETMNRIRMIPTDPETGPVERSDLVRGFEVDKGRYVVVTDDEIQAVRLESTRTLDIERFVDAKE